MGHRGRDVDGDRPVVAAAVTHTLGGLRVDEHARGPDPVDAGHARVLVDAGGIASGGYASGLAQALVLGLAAAESIAA